MGKKVLSVVVVIIMRLILLITFTQEYSVEFSSYFNVMWREPRLEIPRFFLNDFNSSSGLSQGSMIPVNLELVNQLWLPNIFIYNLKTFKVNNL